MSNNELSILFFLQLTIILVVIRLVGIVARKVGQPQVVGEMIVGVMLGPSLLGALSPSLQESLFPRESLPIIYAVAQLGLALYMFLVGAEFNVDLIRERMGAAMAVSWAGILAPFSLGALLALFMLQKEIFFAPEVGIWEAMLFTGSAMSITAFPMLARIIYERGLTKSALGTLALAAGSLDDAAAWSLLALVLASFGGNVMIAISAIGGGIVYAIVVLFIVRPLLTRLHDRAVRQGGLTVPMLGLILALLMLVAWFTDYVGIYAVFGAFILGVSMPRGIVTEELQAKLEPVTTNLLLPLFFIYSGLNTRLGLLVSPALWGFTIIVIAAAVIGKGVACSIAAKITGESLRDSLAVGTLMNARGLMELILLNIGLERGIISPTLFAVLVIMAIVTTLMASPLFELIYRKLPVLELVSSAELVESGEII